MHVDERLPIAARKNLRNGTPERKEQLDILLRDYDTACFLSQLPDKRRAAHWNEKAAILHDRIRQFCAITDTMLANTKTKPKENRFSESLA